MSGREESPVSRSASRSGLSPSGSNMSISNILTMEKTSTPAQSPVGRSEAAGTGSREKMKKTLEQLLPLSSKRTN
jgi:hypothetical protein